MNRWTLKDGTDGRKGYLQILFDGEHAADVFPFGAGRNPDRVRERAYRMVDILNAADSSFASDVDRWGADAPTNS